MIADIFVLIGGTLLIAIVLSQRKEIKRLNQVHAFEIQFLKSIITQRDEERQELYLGEKK